MGAQVGPQLLARAWSAFVIDCVRYRLTVAPVARVELSRWQQHASEIPDACLRELALAKLADEGFHAEAGAMLATLAPRARRGEVVRAIVALEVLYDYLDGRSEMLEPEAARRLFAAFTGALESVEQQPASAGDGQDRRYLAGLASAVRESLAPLPRVDAVRAGLLQAATQASEAQVRVHGGNDAEEWARSEAEGTPLTWREFLAAAAAAVIGCHALIAAASREGTTPEQARELLSAYLPACALTTLLDGVVDHHGEPGDSTSEGREGRGGYIGFYPDREALATALSGLADLALSQGRGGRARGHDVAMLAGIVAYYSTAPGADSGFARGVLAELRARFGMLILPMLALMRAWRARRRRRPAAPSAPTR